MPTTRATRLALVSRLLAGVAAAAALAAAGWLALDALADSPSVSWLIGRAGGLTAYVLLVALVTMGLLMSHPWSRHLYHPPAATRLALHVSLATFTLAFTALHVVVVATEPSSDLGWRDLLLPFASAHRAVPRTLGVLAVWSGLITGVTARLAGRFAARVWWPVHKGAIVAFLLTWAHSVIAGSDSLALRWFYLASGLAVLGLAVSRYSAKTPADRIADLTRAIETVPAQAAEPEVRVPRHVAPVR